MLPAAGLRAGKWSLYEGGHRVPFIVSWGRVMPDGLTRMILMLDKLP